MHSLMQVSYRIQAKPERIGLRYLGPYACIFDYVRLQLFPSCLEIRHVGLFICIWRGMKMQVFFSQWSVTTRAGPLVIDARSSWNRSLLHSNSLTHVHPPHTIPPPSPLLLLLHHHHLIDHPVLPESTLSWGWPTALSFAQPMRITNCDNCMHFKQTIEGLVTLIVYPKLNNDILSRPLRNFSSSPRRTNSVG